MEVNSPAANLIFMIYSLLTDKALARIVDHCQTLSRAGAGDSIAAIEVNDMQ